MGGVSTGSRWGRRIASGGNKKATRQDSEGGGWMTRNDVRNSQSPCLRMSLDAGFCCCRKRLIICGWLFFSESGGCPERLNWNDALIGGSRHQLFGAQILVEVSKIAGLGMW